ncbi:DUF6157 family protein [Pelagibacterium limicola]|uniref:DUF6157 family protein n=1 Tax=Pelagibacterium limicola TaxID=2791022 RepID=UPI0018AFD9EE|nr:DUF6157 family protein [Pelagibacterium limicola]
MHTTNYTQTFITASPDTTVNFGKVPEKPGSIAQLQYALLSERPYEMTSDDLLFEVYAQRNGIDEAKRDEARAAFFSKPQACLRASPLVKQFGWGLHHDAEGRVAMVGVDTDAYREMTHRHDIKCVPGIRTKRG